MGFLSEMLRGEYRHHTIEVRGQNHVLKGLIYTLFVDGLELGHASNFLKLPGHRTIDAQVQLDGKERHLVVEVHQRMLRTEYALTVDGEPVPLTLVE
jgi:hypothetical protein